MLCFPLAPLVGAFLRQPQALSDILAVKNLLLILLSFVFADLQCFSVMSACCLYPSSGLAWQLNLDFLKSKYP